MTEAEILAEIEKLPPQQAIDFLRALAPVGDAEYAALQEQIKNAAFYVSGLESKYLADTVQEAIAVGLETGATNKQISELIAAALDNAGVGLSAQHIDTVVANATATALNAGRMQAGLDPEVIEALPAWTYRTAGDSRVRSSHAALDGFTALKTDPIWRSIYPPNGHNCRCTVISAPAQDVYDAPRDFQPDPGWDKSPLDALEAMANAGKDQ